MPERRLRHGILILILSIAFVLLLGTLTFSQLENWSIIDAFYFVVITTTTVGYGDFVPTHEVSKIITIIYSLMIIPFVLYGFSIIAKYNIETISSKVKRVEHKQTMTEAELEEALKDLERQKQQIKEQKAFNLQQEKQISRQKAKLQETKEELNIVEDVVVETLEDKEKKRKKKTKKKK